MKLLRENEGFTLVELMVVVLIIGVLVAVAIPVFNAASSSARAKSCIANLRTLDGAVEQYRADDKAAPANLAAAQIVLIGYVKSWPACPDPYNVAPAYAYAAGEFACELMDHAY